MDVVFAACTCSVRDPNTGLVVRLQEGDLWAADDPFVRRRPDMFVPDPPNRAIRRTTETVVETATAEPGKRRRTGSEQ